MALESKHFTETEFERCFPVCSLADMDQVFIDKLDFARKLADVPFILNCAYRSSSWDKSRGRSGSGYHTKGRAVDIRCVDSSDRYKIVSACIHCGLSVGIYRTFLHIDDREEPILFWSN